MKKTILVVEDDRLNAKFFDFTLRRRCGHEVEVSQEVDHILERARSGQVGLVIMDVSLSNSFYEGKAVDGPEICRMLKGDARTRHIPVLLATAHAMKGDREDLLRQSGADDYLSKPIADPADLIDKVNSLLAAKR